MKPHISMNRTTHTFNFLIWNVSISKRQAGSLMFVFVAISAMYLPLASSFQNPKPQESFLKAPRIIESSSSSSPSPSSFSFWHIDPDSTERAKEGGTSVQSRQKEEDCIPINICENRTSFFHDDSRTSLVDNHDATSSRTVFSLEKTSLLVDGNNSNNGLSISPRQLTWAIHLFVCMCTMGLLLGPIFFAGVVLLSAGLIKFTTSTGATHDSPKSSKLL